MTNEIEPTPPQDLAGESRKKPILPPSRIAVIVLVVAATVVAVFELRARSCYNNTFEAIGKAMDWEESKESGKKPIAREDLVDLLYGDPKRNLSEDEKSELFTWSGVYRSYRMRVHYKLRGDDQHVFKIESGATAQQEE